MKRTDIESAARLALPDTYARTRLGLDLHPKQAHVLRRLFRPNSRENGLCANEVGKTTHLGAPAVLYAIEMMNAQCISTAGVWMQIVDQLVPALKRHVGMYPDWNFLESSINIDGIPRYTGFSTRDEGFAQGFHRKPGMPLLAIVDEAAAVGDNIINSVEDRCNPDWFLMMGSPLDPVGAFYQAETRNGALYGHHRISQLDCLMEDGYWIPLASILRKVLKYDGVELKGKAELLVYEPRHPFLRSNVWGLFSDQVEGALLSLGEFDACLNNAPPWGSNRTDRHGFLDFAAGRAKNVFAVRVGNKVWIAKKWQEKNTMAAVGEFLATFRELQKEYGLRAEECDGDADGLGLPMIQRLKEVGFPVGEWHGGGKPRFDEMYGNAVSEAWGEGAGKIKRKQIILPDDYDFKAQILSRRTRRNSSGKFLLETKEDLAARNLESPDEADAIVGAMMPKRIAQGLQVMGERETIPHNKGTYGSDEQEWSNEREAAGPAGAWFG